MIYGGSGYKVLLLLHLISVVIAFGPGMLNAMFPTAARKRAEAEGRAINEVNLRVTLASQFAMYGVFVFGFATVGAATKVHGKALISASETWLWLAILAWVVIIGVLHGMVLPAQRKLAAASADSERASLTQRQAIGTGIINVLVVVALILMVFEPGH